MGVLVASGSVVILPLKSFSMVVSSSLISIGSSEPEDEASAADTCPGSIVGLQHHRKSPNVRSSAEVGALEEFED